MKKVFMIAVAAMMATMSAKAQIAEHEEGESTIQPRIGITMSTLTNMDGAEMKVNLTYGVEYEYFVNDQFSLAAGVLFTDQGAKIKDEEDEYKMNIYYVAVPLMANYYVLPGLAVKAGLQPAFRAKTRIEEGDVKIDFDRAMEILFEDDDVEMNKFDLSIPLGLSFEYSHVTLDVRYNLGVTKLLKGWDDTVQNRALVMTLGYKL